MVSPMLAGALSFVLLLLLMAIRMPIAFTFALVGIIGSFYLGGKGAMLGVLGSVPYTWASYYALVTIPMFILMGLFAFHSEISKDLYTAAYKWLGRLPGGLAIATMAACTAFAACTGSSVASAAAMGTIALPEMKRYNYDSRLATATVAIGGTLGILIPPSTIFIIYGVITEESIGQLFIAGIFPGLLLSICYMALIFFRCRFNPMLGPPGPSIPWGEKIASLKGVWGMIFIFLLVMGGIWFGIFTPTEAAGVGAFGSLLFAILRRRVSRHMLTESLTETIRTTCMIFAIIIGAMIFNYFIAITNLPTNLSEIIGGLPVPRYAIIAAILIIYVPLGMFMDALAMIVLTVPIFYGIVVTGLGFSGIWFGVLVVTMVEVGMVTPPVGMNCYVIYGVAKDVPLAEIFRGIIPFVIVAFIGIILIAAFPQISLWLPATMLK